MNQDTELQELIPLLERQLSRTYYTDWEFWIPVALAIFGIWLTYLAFREARSAKVAAKSAATTVKVQTIIIELSEILKSLDTLDRNLRYATARDMLTQNSRKIRRLLSPFEDHADYAEKIQDIRATLLDAQSSLNEARPKDDEEEIPYSIYNSIEIHITGLAGLLADLLGLFEKRTIDHGV